MGPRTDDESPEDDGGMIDLETYEAMHGKPEDQEAEAEDQQPQDGIPTISDERRRELKEQARARIESRLKAKRKQRRLMRGGDV